MKRARLGLGEPETRIDRNVFVGLEGEVSSPPESPVRVGRDDPFFSVEISGNVVLHRLGASGNAEPVALDVPIPEVVRTRPLLQNIDRIELEHLSGGILPPAEPHGVVGIESVDALTDLDVEGGRARTSLLRDDLDDAGAGLGPV